MAEEKIYEVEIAIPAQNRYQNEILVYLLENFSFKRASEIDNKIAETVQSLSTFPNRGQIEEYLKGYPHTFRYILYKETRNFVIKIVYHVNEQHQKVLVTDLFPVLMHPAKVKKRN